MAEGVREPAERAWRGDVDPRDLWRVTGRTEEIAPGVVFLERARALMRRGIFTAAARESAERAGADPSPRV